MNWWIRAAIVLAIGLSIGSGVATMDRRHQVNSQFCTLYTTWVVTLDKAMKDVPIKEAQKNPEAYRRGYKFSVDLEKSLVDQAPCVIKRVPPQNILDRPKVVNPIQPG